MLKRLFRTALSKAVLWAALGFGLAPTSWHLVMASPPDIRLPMFFAFAAISSSLVWLSLFYLAGHLYPQWPREMRIPVALGLYFLIGIPLAFLVVWARSLQGVQFYFWLDLEFAALVLLAWPFMVPFLVVFTPN